MKNKVKFQKELADFAINGYDIAIVDGKPALCFLSYCNECSLSDEKGDCCNCSEKLKRWAEAEYKEPLLDDKEREFLQYLVDKVNPKIVKIAKLYYKNENKYSDKEYITFETIDKNENIASNLPGLKKGTMYKGLKPNKAYTLEELGLTAKK